MKKKIVLSYLKEIADTLDNNNFYKEATSITNVMKRLAQDNTNISDDMSDDLTEEDCKEYLMERLIDKLYRIIPWNLNKEDNPIHKFSGSEKLRFVCKEMNDIFAMTPEHPSLKKIRVIANQIREFIIMFRNSEPIIRQRKSDQKINSFMSFLDETEKAIEEGRAKEFYYSLPEYIINE